MHPFIILFFSGTPENSMKPNTLTTVGHYIKIFQIHTGLTENEDTSNKSENNTQIIPNISH